MYYIKLTAAVILIMFILSIVFFGLTGCGGDPSHSALVVEKTSFDLHVDKYCMNGIVDYSFYGDDCMKCHIDPRSPMTIVVNCFYKVN